MNNIFGTGNLESKIISISRLMSISRPRFWLYELGMYIIGVAAVLGTTGQFWGSMWFIIFFIYFMFPANIYIYGINDIFDYETDKLNPKKVAYESLVVPEEHPYLWKIIILKNIPFLIILGLFYLNAQNTFSNSILQTLFQSSVTNWTGVFISFILFLFFAGFYSAKPIRAKATPFLDSFFSAGHYVATAFFGWYLAGGQEFYPLLLVAGMAWAIAMHAYSAVPDIEADKQAQLETIATKLGEKLTLFLCLFLYTLSTVIASMFIPWFGILCFVVYSILIGLSFYSIRQNSTLSLFTIYTYFPIVNALIGMLLFFLVLFY